MPGSLESQNQKLTLNRTRQEQQELEQEEGGT